MTLSASGLEMLSGDRTDLLLPNLVMAVVNETFMCGSDLDDTACFGWVALSGVI